MEKDFDLDALFAEAAARPMEPGPDLTARILSDAAALQPKPQGFLRPVVAEKPEGGFFGWALALNDVLGGGRALAGLSLAGITGLYLGVAQPDLLTTVTQALSGTVSTAEQLDLLPATGTLWTEE